ncbi:pheromone processing endoprotease, partial [Coemansia biformis]
FMSVKHWDEDPVGSWKLQVRNAYQPQYSGTFNSWQLTVYGESTEAEPPHKVPVVDDGPEALPLPPPPPSDKESTHIPDGNDGRGHIGKAIAVLLSVAFFVAGAAVAGLATVVVMRWRERKLGAARWAPLQNMDRSEEEVIFSADPLPDEDAFEYTDVTAGASSASVVKHHGRSGGDGGAGDGAENSRSHGGSRHDSEDTAENYPLV